MNYVEILEHELNLLREILKKAPLSKEDLLFADQFPKTCSNCSKLYNTRIDYLESTTPAAAGSLLFSEYGLQEFRNCTCGTTLTFWGIDADRRDITHEGALKRAIFMNCMDKLVACNLGTRDLLRSSLRQIFELESKKVS